VQPRSSLELASASGPTDARAPNGTPLYVHLPFCAAKCTYCDFYSVAAEGQDLTGLVGALLLEAELRAPWHPRTVFLGGGTPSLLPRALQERLLDGLQRCTGFRDSAVEVTAECNPESLDRDKARCLLDLGVDRLSIGIQSLRDDALQLLGRVHSAVDALRAYDAARDAGARNVNVDLIFALPGQTPAAWREDLARIQALHPDHVAAYNLAFEEETPFHRWLAEGKLERQAEEVELELFWATREQLSGSGHDAYEISNFSRTDHECLHNVNYWENGAYAGVGPSAASCYAGERRGNVRSVSGYVQAVRKGQSAADWREQLPPLERLGETWWLGLRMSRGIDPLVARRVAGLDADQPDPAQGIAERLAEQGFLELDQGRFRLTRRGLPVADALAREFLSPNQAAAAGPR
jgi:putative oxygen-independent coproporphyrinogen III oxidase